MAKFGLYDQNGSKPNEPKQEYEGTYLFAKDDIVCVMANAGDGTGDKAFAVVRLAPGQSVKIVK
jgi:hypothetical protein